VYIPCVGEQVRQVGHASGSCDVGHMTGHSVGDCGGVGHVTGVGVMGQVGQVGGEIPATEE
jgi:hypothetical protein